MGEGRNLMDSGEVSGVRKAAVLLLTIDEEMSKEVIKELDEDEIETLGKEIADLKFIPNDLVSRVHDEFIKKLEKRNKHVTGGESKFKMLIKRSFGEEKADQFLENMETKKGMPGEFLRASDPKVLANIIRGEHPQTMALVLSILSVKKACDVLANLPEKLQSDVVTRMAFLEKVDKRVLEEVENVLKEQLESVGVVDGRQLGGVDLVASILNQMDRTLETELLGRLEEANPDLAEKIRQLMFTFEDLIKLDDKGIQVLLKDVSSDDIAIALKAASETIKEKIFANMSDRAGAMLREDLEAMGPVRATDAEKAQIKIAMVAKKLDAEGKIVLSRGGERFV
jgi:flagellar motor switch protein FliG